MSLVDVEMPSCQRSWSRELHQILAESQHRVDAFLGSRDGALSSFVPSNAERVLQSLGAIMQSGLVSGTRFLEWGSGFGVATVLASKIGFDAVGIEAEPILVDHARKLARDVASSAHFVCGSFIPAGGKSLILDSIEVDDDKPSWLVAETDDAYDQLDGQVDEFDLIFAYPWPGEEATIERLFEIFATRGALLLTYHESDTVQLKRKPFRRRNRP